MKRTNRWWACAMIAMALAWPRSADAAFHLWQIVEVFSDPTGTVQFVEMFTTSSSETLISNHVLKSGGHTFTIPAPNLGSATTNKSLLFGTPGYAALTGEPPADYIFLQNNFFDPDGDTVNFADVSIVPFSDAQLPKNGSDSLNRNFNALPGVFFTAVNTPKDFAGTTGTINVPPPGWKVDADGNWSAGANWNGGVPSAAGAAANFGSAITAPRTVTVDAPQTVGTIKFDNANAYTIAGPAGLTLNNSGAAAIDVVTGSHTISAPLSVAAGNSLVKTGAGTLTLSGPQSHAAGTSLTVATGTLNFNADGGANLSLESDATINLGASQHLAALTLGTGAGINLAPGGKLIRTPSVLLTDTSRLDLADGKLIFDGDAATRSARLLQTTLAIRTGAAGLAWTGPGIRSSAAAGDPNLLTAIGLMSNDNGLGGAYHTTFGGEAVDANSVLARYTYYGDADLSGLVDGTDYALIDNGFNASLVGWFNGDFDYSGLIDGTDYALIDNAFNSQGAPLGIAVPEPGTLALGLAALGLLLVFATRRRTCWQSQPA